MSANVKAYPDKVFLYARDQAKTEELPWLLDHLDAYMAGVKEASIAAGISLGRQQGVQELLLLNREALRGIQEILIERGWHLKGDAKTWVAP